MLKGVRTAAGRRIYDCPDFEEDKSKCKEKCCKAGVEYEGPQENEDYLLSSVEKEEKGRAEEVTQKRRKRVRTRCKRENERAEKTMDKGREVRVGAFCDNDPNKRQQQVCAVCDTVIRSAPKSSLPCQKKSSCQMRLTSA